jgi:hypothetical protein
MKVGIAENRRARARGIAHEESRRTGSGEVMALLHHLYCVLQLLDAALSQASSDSRPSMPNTDLCSGAVLDSQPGQPVGWAVPTDEREGDRMFRWKGR